MGPCPAILFKALSHNSFQGLAQKYSYGLAPDEIGNIWQENRVSTGEAIWDLRALEKCIKIQDLLVFGPSGIRCFNVGSFTKAGPVEMGYVKVGHTLKCFQPLFLQAKEI